MIVDQISDSQEIVVKPLGQQLKGLNCYAGATIMGDGRIALILDIVGIGVLSGVIARRAGQAQRRPPRGAARRLRRPPEGPCCCSAPAAFERLAMPLSQVARLENIPATSVERAAGRAVVQYRQRILPLLLAEMLGGSRRGRRDPARSSSTATRTSEFGLVVDEITDIVDGTVGNPVSLRTPGLAGLGGRRRPGDGFSGSRSGRPMGLRIDSGVAVESLRRRSRKAPAMALGGGARMTRSRPPMPPSQYATFLVAGSLPRIEVLEVQEVLREQRLTPVPLAPAVVAGLINLRGQIVPELDMRRMLRLPPRADGSRPFSVVVRTEHGAVSLRVDEIGDVLELDASSFELPPRNVDAHLRAAARGAQVERPSAAGVGHRPDGGGRRGISS